MPFDSMTPGHFNNISNGPTILNLRQKPQATLTFGTDSPANITYLRFFLHRRNIRMSHPHPECQLNAKYRILTMIRFVILGYGRRLMQKTRPLGAGGHAHGARCTESMFMIPSQCNRTNSRTKDTHPPLRVHMSITARNWNNCGVSRRSALKLQTSGALCLCLC